MRYQKGMHLRDFWNRYCYTPEETNELFGSFAEDIKKRRYLTRNDLMRILLWKVGRVVEKNENKIIKVTRRIFEINHENEKEVKDLLNELKNLDGIQILMASTILSILFPEKYGIFDKNARKALEGKTSTKSLEAFLKYQTKIREIAQEQSKTDGEKWTPRDVDKALWVLGKEKKSNHGV